ncbi:hypothetical protein ACFYWN_41455 [Streptomyces sp. NPDC002917]|nr:hypothetical protein [Streptomyces sp. NBC_00562]WUC23215.1 hypothetical protein OHA33_32560 [Streptomyces sp. NBC_00562]
MARVLHRPSADAVTSAGQKHVADSFTRDNANEHGPAPTTLSVAN